MEKGSKELIYRKDGISFEKIGSCYYLFVEERKYRISDYPECRCLYVKCPDGKMFTIHNAFTVIDLCIAADHNSSMKMYSNNTYDINGVFRLLCKAIELAVPDMDISFIEANCFIDFMKEHGAVSPETGVSLADAGIDYPIMLPFVESKKVGMTPGGLYYLRSPDEENREEPADSSRYSRLISNQVRFGYGYRDFDGQRHYYAWYGSPSRNDDFITFAEISAAECAQIERTYPRDFSADREIGERFSNKYIAGHKVIKKGWNVTLPEDFTW